MAVDEMVDVGARRDIERFGVWIPADVRQLSLLRAVAETVLLTVDFTLDVVTDVRVALDEVITAMILAAAPGQRIECEFGYDPTRVEVIMSVLAHRDAFELSAFGGHLLESLTDSIEIDRAPAGDGSAAEALTVRFSRRAHGGERR
ncbi:ATP-binding protein [Nocardia inohanensis]|uniref:ATP-binding protein n=1 Tax=Nocardia inohanensis TaxID=209246 RepID=UPI000831C421|nr:hypothetical protein [Nocardia inohanensis]